MAFLRTNSLSEQPSFASLLQTDDSMAALDDVLSPVSDLAVQFDSQHLAETPRRKLSMSEDSPNSEIAITKTKPHPIDVENDNDDSVFLVQPGIGDPVDLNESERESMSNSFTDLRNKFETSPPVFRLDMASTSTDFSTSPFSTHANDDDTRDGFEPSSVAFRGLTATTTLNVDCDGHNDGFLSIPQTESIRRPSSGLGGSIDSSGLTPVCSAGYTITPSPSSVFLEDDHGSRDSGYSGGSSMCCSSRDGSFKFGSCLSSSTPNATQRRFTVPDDVVLKPGRSKKMSAPASMFMLNQSPDQSDDEAIFDDLLIENDNNEQMTLTSKQSESISVLISQNQKQPVISKRAKLAARKFSRPALATINQSPSPTHRGDSDVNKSSVDANSTKVSALSRPFARLHSMQSMGLKRRHDRENVGHPVAKPLLVRDNPVLHHCSQSVDSPMGLYQSNNPLKRFKPLLVSPPVSRGTLHRCYSEADVLTSHVAVSQSGPSSPTAPHDHALPCKPLARANGLMCVTPDTVRRLVDGDFTESDDCLIDDFYLIDCRYPYEFDGGKIPGSMNLHILEEVESFFMSSNRRLHPKDPDRLRRVVIFYCEFSSERGPKMMKAFRKKDREAVGHENYPDLHYPELYLMEGGYSTFYADHPEICEGAYTKMIDDEEQCRHFRMKSKSAQSMRALKSKNVMQHPLRHARQIDSGRNSLARRQL